jgi:ankyrin repeat protein
MYTQALDEYHKQHNNIEIKLRQACFKGYYNTVKAMVEYGVDVNLCDSRNSPPLHIAASYGYLDIVMYLVEHNANINQVYNKKTALYHACFDRKNINIVKYLVRCGADTNL